MANGRLLNLKKEVKEETTRIYKKHLIVGEDLFSVALFEKLQKSLPKDELALLSSDELGLDSIRPMGPSSLRGEENISRFKDYFPDIEIKEFDRPSLFFKELKWREFGGRAKSEELIWNEPFFTERRAEIDLTKLYSFLEEEDFFKKLNEARLSAYILRIERRESSDLLEPCSYAIICTNGMVIEVENLYWGCGPESFLELFQERNTLTPQFIEFCEGTHSPSSLTISLEFESIVTEMKETLFIPLSYTHSWGHFIGEFQESEKGQKAEFITFLDKDQTTEEEVSRKIRLFKRSLEKIFPNFSKISYKEFIKLSDYSPCPKVDDGFFASAPKCLENFFFVSNNAPLENFSQLENNFEDSKSGLCFFSRGAIRTSELSNSFGL